jgi:hypothetical protein
MEVIAISSYVQDLKGVVTYACASVGISVSILAENNFPLLTACIFSEIAETVTRKAAEYFEAW